MTFTFPSASVSSRRRLVPIQRLAVVGQCNLTSRRLAERSGWGLPRPLSAARCPLSAPLRTLARLTCQARFRPIAEVSAFPERRMVFATPGWKGRLVPTGVFPPCMNLDSPF